MFFAGEPDRKVVEFNAQQAWTWQERRAAGALAWIVVLFVGAPSLVVALISMMFNAGFVWEISGDWQEKIAWLSASLALSSLVIGLPVARPYLRERQPDVARWSLWLWVGLLAFSSFGASAFLFAKEVRPQPPVHIEQSAPRDEIAGLEAELDKVVGPYGLPARRNCEMGQPIECRNLSERAHVLANIKRAAELETKLLALQKAKKRAEMGPPPAPASKNVEGVASTKAIGSAILQKAMSVFVATLVEAASAIGLWIAAEAYVAILDKKRRVLSTGASATGEPLLETARPGNLPSLNGTQAKPVQWLWPQVMPAGKLTLLGGLPGLGKSQITVSMAAIISRGDAWPAGNKQAPRGATLFLVSEDDIADTVKPRLEAAGADMGLVFATNEPFDLSVDLEGLKALAEQIPDLRLIVFDPISRYVKGTTPAKTRASLDAYNMWAAARGIASIGIRHPPKGKAANAQNLFSGSAEEIRIARGAWIALPDLAAANRAFFLLAKSNHIADKRGFAYRIEGVRLPGGIKTSRIVWENKRIAGTADDYLAATMRAGAGAVLQ